MDGNESAAGDRRQPDPARDHRDRHRRHDPAVEPRRRAHLPVPRRRDRRQRRARMLFSQDDLARGVLDKEMDARRATAARAISAGTCARTARCSGPTACCIRSADRDGKHTGLRQDPARRHRGKADRRGGIAPGPGGQPHRAGEPHRIPQPLRRHARGGAAPRASCCCCCCWTWTISRASTTGSAMRSAMPCCNRPRIACARRCATPTSSRAWAATSSRS